MKTISELIRQRDRAAKEAAKYHDRFIQWKAKADKADKEIDDWQNMKGEYSIIKEAARPVTAAEIAGRIRRQDHADREQRARPIMGGDNGFTRIEED